MIDLFPPEVWRERQGLPELLDALGAHNGDTRFIGGFVRDTLLGLPTADIDCATRLTPELVSQRISLAGFKAVPTGIAHGTVTAVLPCGPIEITTLRRDLDTDGRRAQIAFSEDWREDAARRDFTINALSAEPVSGAIHDYFSGQTDLEAGLVRFIGEPLTRIAEDHLRILRFFRFHARFGKGDPDRAALAACIARARDLMALSRERIADELLKLLDLPDPAPTITLMVQNDILVPVLPEIDRQAPDRLSTLIAAELASRIPGHALRRLAALLPPDSERAEAIARRLKLSNIARRRLSLAVQPLISLQEAADSLELAYRVGKQAALDRLLLAGEPQAAAALVDRDIPKLPISGGMLVKLGLAEGPEVAATLKAIEARWIDEGFPGPERARVIAEALVRRPSED